jgi:hypothetical protein
MEGLNRNQRGGIMTDHGREPVSVPAPPAPHWIDLTETNEEAS